MNEFKIIDKEESKPKEIKEGKSMKEMVSLIHDALDTGKKRRIKLPRRARVKKRKLKKGWIGALIIEENRNIHGERVKIEGGCFNEKDGTYHATDGREIFFFEGKFPVIIQPKWRANPIEIGKEIPKQNETYGLKYIKARLLADVIKIKSKGGSIVIWIILIIAVLFGINYFMGGA